jgi:hypothetical protein|tara:strand:- start:1005 stop:1400 length:396 start_codon:yes stop_codon:yes gene_type:complete
MLTEYMEVNELSFKETYNGWTNYETWCLNIWIDNDQYLNERKAELIREVTLHYDDKQAYELSLLLENMVEELKDNALEVGLLSDLLGGAIGKINFFELAEHYIEDFNEDFKRYQEENEELRKERLANFNKS